jgi:hypothetical protein
MIVCGLIGAILVPSALAADPTPASPLGVVRRSRRPTRTRRATRPRRPSPLRRSGRGEPIQPEDEWHVDHNDARDGYLGVSYAAGNLRDGGHKTTGKRRPHPFVQQPYRWSQRWFDDPPIGTISYDGRRNPEITSARPNGSLLMRRGSTSPNSRKKACHLGN